MLIFGILLALASAASFYVAWSQYNLRFAVIGFICAVVTIPTFTTWIVG
jgi:hypothetical protein